jgi:hypothetical protein
VTTIDVEESVLGKPDSAGEQYTACDKPGDPRCAGHAATEAARSASTLLNLALYPVEVVLHGIPRCRHLDI